MDFYKKFLRVRIAPPSPKVVFFLGMLAFLLFVVVVSRSAITPPFPCNNNNGHIIWYTKGNSCSYVNYVSCSLNRIDVPSGGIRGCTEQEKISILQEDKIQLEGRAPRDSFARTCQEAIQFMYDPALVLGVYERQLDRFYSWGITGRTIAEACKPFISDQLYQKAILDPNIMPSSDCDYVPNGSERFNCRSNTLTFDRYNQYPKVIPNENITSLRKCDYISNPSERLQCKESIRAGGI